VPAIAAMGSKSAAKEIMSKASVPLVPGYHGDNQDEQFLAAEANRIGYPLLLKAAYGGGGKGMKVVWQASEFLEQLHSAKREALNGFGNDKILMERYLTKPRHVEIQVFADNFGNAVYLHERDCSIQRRHQKVIEEAPAPNFSAEQRKAMGEAAVTAAKAIGYAGAGTVEFLFDEDGSFYFMEMNTRLQVEHPVTEMITGQDLVKWQLLVASNQPLPLTQADIPLDGHAIEVRVYAEDPDNNFLPATGKLTYLRQPDEHRHVRVDTGVVEYDEVSPFYDPMIAKLIVWDESRDLAIARMRRALDDYRIAGVKTNLAFLSRLVSHPAFAAAELDTHFIEHHQAELFAPEQSEPQQALLLAALYLLMLQQPKTTGNSPWSCGYGWRLNEAAQVRFTLQHGEVAQQVQIQSTATGHQLCVGDYCIEAKAKLDADVLTATLSGAQGSQHQFQVRVSQYVQNAQQKTVSVFIRHQRFDFVYQTQVEVAAADESAGSLKAPMNGTVVAVMASAGQRVQSGETLLVMEAMKMEYAIKAPADGVVNSVFYQAGDLVKDGAELVDFSADAGDKV
jgi:3-methylcrotonyl-CoA carboxylase alpha subunit